VCGPARRYGNFKKRNPNIRGHFQMKNPEKDGQTRTFQKIYAVKGAAQTKTPQQMPRRFCGLAWARSDLLDRFQHLENRLVRADEKTLVVLAEATALKRVATIAFAFSCHDVSGAVS
jgi:hypothetical protein